MVEKAERSEGDLRDYGMEYDQRLSLRVHKRQIAILDAAAKHEKMSRTNFVRGFINALGRRLQEEGIEF